MTDLGGGPSHDGQTADGGWTVPADADRALRNALARGWEAARLNRVVGIVSELAILTSVTGIVVAFGGRERAWLWWLAGLALAGVIGATARLTGVRHWPWRDSRDGFSPFYHSHSTRVYSGSQARLHANSEALWFLLDELSRRRITIAELEKEWARAATIAEVANRQRLRRRTRRFSNLLLALGLPLTRDVSEQLAADRMRARLSGQLGQLWTRAQVEGNRGGHVNG